MPLRTRKQSILLATLLLLSVGGGVFWFAYTAQGVNRTWDGGGTDGTCGGGAGDGNKWSCAANWSGDVAPTASDVAIFDGTSTKDATIASNISVAGISINAGYTGTITQTSTFTVTVGGSHYSQAAGTFTGGSGAITINGTYTLSGGTFTSTSGNLKIGLGNSGETLVAISSGTFNHNNGTVTFQAYSTGGGSADVIDVNTSLTLYDVVTDAATFTNRFVVNSGDTIIATNNFTQNNGSLEGTWEVQGNVTIGSTADGGVGTLTMTGTGSKTYTYSAGGHGPHLRVNNAALTVTPNAGTTSLSTVLFSVLAGTFTAPTGNFTVGQNSGSETFFQVASGAIFNHNNGTCTFVPGNTGGGTTDAIDVDTSLILYDVVLNTENSNTVYTASGDTVIISHDFTHTNGVLNGTWEVQGNYTVATTADGGTAGITFTGGNNQTYTDQGGNEPDGDVLVNKSGGTVTLASNADWNATNQDVTVTSGTLASSTFNITTTNFTVNGGTFTGGSGTVTTSGPMVVSSGTFTGGAGNIIITATSGFTLSGGTFTSTSGTLSVATFTHTAGGTFNHNNGTVLVAANTGVIDVATSETFYDLTFNNNFFGTVSSGDTAIVTGTFTLTNGTVDIGTIEARGNAVIGSGADGGTGTLSFLVSGDQTIAGNGGTVCNLNINKSSGTLSAGSTNLSSANFTLSGGTFSSTSGTLFVNAFTHTSGGTFNHNNGTVTFGGFHTTLDVASSETFYNLTLNKNNGYQLALSNDTVIVLGMLTQTEGAFMSGVLESQGNVVIASTADGGTATINFTGGNNQTYTDQGGNEPDGDVTINKTPGSSVRLASNADWNASGQDLTIISGELNMGASYNISTTALTVSTNGHLSNYGTGDLTLAGNVSNSGNIRFMSSGSCGGSDSISIASSSAGVQRTWSGSGTYLFHDVTVQDQGGSAAITAYSSTSVSGNGVNWTFSGAACPATAPAAQINSGIINFGTGSYRLP